MRALIAASLLCLPAALPAQHDTPASVLLFPLIRTACNYVTIVSVTNTDLTPKVPFSYGGSTMVAFEYFNVEERASDPFRPAGCTLFCRGELLTPADTLSVATYCHDVPIFAAQQGYLAVIAMDPTQYKTPWSHEALIGSSLHVRSSGVVFHLPAFPIHSPVPHHLPTDLNTNSQLDFDGLEYLPIPDRFMADSVIPCLDSHLTVVSLTGVPSDVHTLYLSIWNDNEFPLSSTLAFSCWFDQPFSTVSPAFTEGFLHSLPNDPSELDITCDGRQDLEGAWTIIQSLGVINDVNIRVANDGAFVAYLTAGRSPLWFGRPLWESVETQTNGSLPVR